MPTPPSEPRNPFYVLLMVASLAFVATALAFAVVPVLEEKAIAMGEDPPPSPFRDALRRDGGTWLIAEVVAMIAFGMASMVLDRWRRLREAASPPSPAASPPSQQPGS